MRWTVKATHRAVMTLQPPKRRWVIHTQLVSASSIYMRETYGRKLTPWCDQMRANGSRGDNNHSATAREVRTCVMQQEDRAGAYELTSLITQKLGVMAEFTPLFGLYCRGEVLRYRRFHSAVWRND